MKQESPTYQRGITLSPVSRLARQPIPKPIRHGLREGARALGSLTSAQRPAPDFLIIGTKKGGTSSLMNWLLQHPAVSPMFPAPQGIKSPHYFDMNYWRGPKWYASHFPTYTARHRLERRIGATSAVGEASPYYMFHPAVPARVATDLPDVRVIAILRHPVSRAYSNYWDRKAYGSEQLPTFEAAIEAESQRMAGVDFDRLRSDPRYYSFDHDHHTYLARGRYAEHLKPWLDLIPRENLLVLNAEDLFRASDATFARTQRFLGLPVWSGVKLERYNSRKQPSINPDTKARLCAYYRPYNEELYELLGEDLGWD